MDDGERHAETPRAYSWLDLTIHPAIVVVVALVASRIPRATVMHRINRYRYIIGAEQGLQRRRICWVKRLRTCGRWAKNCDVMRLISTGRSRNLWGYTRRSLCHQWSRSDVHMVLVSDVADGVTSSTFILFSMRVISKLA